MILDDIVAKKKIRVEERKKQIPIGEIRKQAIDKCNFVSIHTNTSCDFYLSLISSTL